MDKEELEGIDPTDGEQSIDRLPFEELRDRLEGQRGDEDEGKTAFDRLAGLSHADPDGDAGDRWTALRREVTRRANAIERVAERDNPNGPKRPGQSVSRHRPATSLRDNFRVHVLATHGFVTFGLFGLGLGVMVAAIASIIPTPFWLFSLPLLLTALIGVLPITAWALGVWDPQQI